MILYNLNNTSHKQTLRSVCITISRNIYKQKFPHIKKDQCKVLHLVNFERLVDVETRLKAEHFIKRGFYDPMSGLKGKPDPVLLKRSTKFVNIYPQ